MASGYLRKLGFVARRGQQFAGGQDSPDVIVEELPQVHIECKFGEGYALGTALLYKAYAQAVRDAGEIKTPCVLWRTNRSPWKLTFTTEGPVVLATVCGDMEIRHALLYLQREAEEETP
jgi:hypothetical protein